MAASAFNIGKGRHVELSNRGANFVVLLLEVAEAHATLVDYDTVQDLLNAAGNTEVQDGSYARKTGVAGTVTVDDSADDVTVSLPDQTWTQLAGNNPVVAVIAYSLAGGDANLVPLSVHDVSMSSDGSDFMLRMP